MSLLALPIPDDETTTAGQRRTIDHTVEEQLRRSSYRALRAISCITSDGVVSLCGLLPSYYLKQVAQEIASGVEGVRQVINRIEVLPPSAPKPSDPGQPAEATPAQKPFVRRIVFTNHTTN